MDTLSERTPLKDRLARCVARFAGRPEDWTVFGFKTALDPRFARERRRYLGASGSTGPSDFPTKPQPSHPQYADPELLKLREAVPMSTALAASGTEGAVAAVRRFWRAMRLRLRANCRGNSESPAMIPIQPDCWPIH
jgi:hypothetical protein